MGITAKEINRFISTSINPPTQVKFSGHHLKWSWEINQTTNRKPDKQVKLGKGKGWLKKIYYFKGATIVVNLYTLELWLTSRPYKDVTKMVFSKWSIADKIAREFSTFAQIAIKPIKTEHPADISKAHLVMTTKVLNPILKPMSQVKDEVGLIYDQSHPNFPELTGEKSVEGAKGAEWFFTKFPAQFEVMLEVLKGFDEYNRNIKLHLEVLEEIKVGLKEDSIIRRETLEQLRRNKKGENGVKSK